MYSRSLQKEILDFIKRSVFFLKNSTQSFRLSNIIEKNFSKLSYFVFHEKNCFSKNCSCVMLLFLNFPSPGFISFFIFNFFSVYAELLHKELLFFHSPLTLVLSDLQNKKTLVKDWQKKELKHRFVATSCKA